MTFAERKGRERAASAAAVLLCHAVLVGLLISGIGRDHPRRERKPLAVFDVRRPPPPPPLIEVVPPKAPVGKAAGRASPPDRTAAPSPVVAPPPAVRIETAPPVAAAPVAGNGPDRSAGTAPVTGPGTGSGGAHSGVGSGGSGAGTGSGDGNGAGGARPTRARLIAGSLSATDYPRVLRGAGVGGRVEIHITVDPDGQVGRCLVIRSSGSAELDATTCALVRERYRFEPARDAAGRAVADLVGESHLWTSGRRGR
jgi:protein TonB